MRDKDLYFICLLLTGWICIDCSFAAKGSDKNLIVYSAPEGIKQNNDYTVKVRIKDADWQDLHEYDAEVGRYKTYHTSYVYFDSDFSKKIEVQVTKNSGTVNSVKIRPSSFGIKYTRHGNTISFFLDKPIKLSVEFDGDIYNNLQVFANPIEVNPPQKDEPGVVYFGPGISEPGLINLSSNQTLYIAGGAVVRGYIVVDDAQNVKITGRGILDNSTHIIPERTRLLRINNSGNVTVDGIFLIDSQTWTVVPTWSKNVTINNIKILNEVIFSDGIDVVSCQNVHIDDVFIRNGDDCISIKARGEKSNSDIVITNSIFWSDAAHAILIGPEANGTVTERLLYEKNEILEVHCEAGQEWWGAIGITNSGNQIIRDITFKDINIDNFTLSELLNIRIDSNRYVSIPGNRVKNIQFINVSYDGPNTNPSHIYGYDSTRYVDGVYFENLQIKGKKILNANEANLSIGSYARNIQFK